MTLAERVLSLLPAELRELSESHAALAGAIEQFQAAANAGCDLPVAEDDLLAFVAPRLPLDALPHEALVGLHAADLKLAFACTRDVRGAVERLQALARQAAERAVRRFHPSGALVDDIVQQMMTELVVGESCKIAGYRGTGSLLAWLRVIAFRHAIRETEKFAREQPVGESSIFDRLLPEDDPELRAIQLAARQRFKSAFARAVRGLSCFDRELLREHVLDGANIDSIAARHEVHRASAARWLAKIRESLLQETRHELARELGVVDGDLDGLIQIFDSRLTASLDRLLS